MNITYRRKWGSGVFNAALRSLFRLESRCSHGILATRSATFAVILRFGPLYNMVTAFFCLVRSGDEGIDLQAKIEMHTREKITKLSIHSQANAHVLRCWRSCFNFKFAGSV